MKIDSIRRAILFAGLVLPLTWASGSLEGQSFGVGVATASVNQKAPSAVLPPGSAMAQDQASDVSVAGMVTAQDVFVIATDVMSSSTLGKVSVLNGLITADGIVAMASSSVGNTNADGSSLANLVVNGVEVSEPAPNTRMNLPGVGYVVLNEQIPSASGITVNMIHVVLQQAVLGALGGVSGYQTTGNIIVGSASSSVN